MNIDGKMVAAEVRERVASQVKDLKEKTGKVPGLAVVLVGDDAASAVYVKNKGKACEKAGINSYEHFLPADTPQKTLVDLIDQLNNEEKVNGILVQLPLPIQIDSQKVLERINPGKDVDGFHPLNFGYLAGGNPTLAPCTPAGIIELLDHYKIEIEGKHAVVLGRSNIVGKPLALMLLQRNATVTICHSRTKNLLDITQSADLLFAAVGRVGFVTAEMVREGATVIDVGIHRVDGKLAGDVKFDEVNEKAAWLTPVPGGVGPMTIAMLLQNTVRAFKIANQV
ncbi:MAG: bifunctional methylenetetrahydrofolate dehydrogenase/methenyltetrahydrofolate cyclohydrolase FolD [Nitrospinales bacterium]